MRSDYRYSGFDPYHSSEAKSRRSERGFNLAEGQPSSRYTDSRRRPKERSPQLTSSGDEAEEDDGGTEHSCSRFLKRIKWAFVGGKDLVVPEGTFGTGPKARRTEWCALCVFLSLWIPVYVIFFYVSIAIWVSGWIEGMSVQTSYVNTLAIPSIIFCPKNFQCGMHAIMSEQTDSWSQVFPEFGHSPDIHPLPSPSSQTPPSILPLGRLNLTFSKLGRRSHIIQELDGHTLHVCGCGQCVCLRSFLLNFTASESEEPERFGAPFVETRNRNRFNRTRYIFGKMFPGFFRHKIDTPPMQLTPEFESLVNAPSKVRALHQGAFGIRGFFNTEALHVTGENEEDDADEKQSYSIKAHGHIRMGLYGANVPLTSLGFPERPSWISLPVDTSSRLLFRLNRVRLDQQGLLSIVTSMLHMWAPFLLQHHRWHQQRIAMYAEHHEYRTAMTQLLYANNREVAEFRRVGDSLTYLSAPMDDGPVEGPIGSERPSIDKKVAEVSNVCSGGTLVDCCPTCRHRFEDSIQRLLIPETALSMGVMTFFQREQARVGAALSVLATSVLAGVFLVLIHRIGAFFVCFRRHEARHPRLMVSPLLRKITGGHVSENHIFVDDFIDHQQRSME